MLEVDEDSRLGRELIAGGARYHAHFVPDDDATADFYQQACETLASAGIAQYEISNFARTASHSKNGELQSNESRHNLKYWTRQPYLGFGVDAHSMLELVWGRAPSRACPERSRRSKPSAARQLLGLMATPDSRYAASRKTVHQAVRFATPDSLDAYMNRAPHTVTPVSAQAAIEESFFLGLRLNRGIDLARLQTEFGSVFEPANFLKLDCHPERSEGPAVCRYPAKSESSLSPSRPTVSRDAVATWESAIQQCVHDGLLEQQGTTLRLTARGRLLSNEVFARFLAEETKVGTGHVNPR